MLGAHLTVSIDTLQPASTSQNFSLLFREEFGTVRTFMQVIFFFFQQQFQFLHEEARYDLIFSFLQAVQSVKTDFFSHLSDDVSVDALHVDLNARDLFNMFANEIKTLSDEPVDLEELSWDQNCNRIFNIKFWPSILHDRRIGKRLVFLFWLLSFQLPLRVFHESIILALLLFILLHRKNIIQEPLKDLSVTVDRNVDLIIVADLFQASVEVLHILDEQRAGECEVTLILLTVINHMNHD
jgi:hypothetical protein